MYNKTPEWQDHYTCQVSLMGGVYYDLTLQGVVPHAHQAKLKQYPQK
ncbi:hypothetical protein [Metabacillus sp. FJAT-53654]|uniref:Uncharacterized protein n=1 Tax=Metabacillus rhizosphaerae TaxID=3117747 RepID=A0ABZ2MWC1_9BACI